MTDFIDDYRKRVRKKLSRAENGPILRMAEALCFPSFHAETLLRVTEEVERTTCRLFTFSASLWYSKEGGTPTRLQESITVLPVRAKQFWAAIEDLRPEAIQVERTIGLDGMSVSATFRRNGITTLFEVWSPKPMTPAGRFIRLIFELAWESMRSQSSIERLEQLHGYLRLGLPARIIDGSVKCLRIFGGLSTGDEESLQEVFDSLHGTDALVIDMTNFEGMGTLLYPLFVKFASKRRHLAWAASGHARQQIEAMGLREPRIFDRTDDAVQWIVSQGNLRA